MDLRSSGRTESCVFEFEFDERKFFPSGGKSWKTNRVGMEKLRLANRLFASADALRYKLYFDDYPVQELSHMWMDVEIKGVDVYDPTTGQIRNSSTDDIACWFIDTDYNGESFFVRHAYFTGADEPYDKLKRALRAEIDEAAWSSLYSTMSRPFAKPDNRQDRGEGHQPLRRRGAEGVRCLSCALWWGLARPFS